MGSTILQLMKLTVLAENSGFFNFYFHTYDNSLQAFLR
jgi:hypothetical protein